MKEVNENAKTIEESRIGNAIVKLDTANQEYDFRLPKNLSGIRFQCRDGTAFRYSFFKDTVGTAAPSEPYGTVLANGFRRFTNLNLSEETPIYFACGGASKVIEIDLWYKEETIDP